MSRRPHRPWFRPHLLTLEERLPLGDGVLGLLVGAALLSDAIPARAVVQPPASGERGVLTPRWETVTGGSHHPLTGGQDPRRVGNAHRNPFWLKWLTFFAANLDTAGPAP